MSLLGLGCFELAVSVPLVLEYEKVLSRQRLELGLSQQDVADLIDTVCLLATHQKIHFLWRPYLRDEKDEFVLELAVAAGCGYIITYNRRDFDGADKFGIKVINPREFLVEIGELK